MRDFLESNFISITSMWCNTQWIKYFFHSMVLITELDRENPDLPPYLISHGQKIESSRVLLATHSEVADCVSVALASLKRAMWTQHKWPWSCAKLLSSSTRAVRLGPDSTQFLLHRWRRHYTWRHRESGFSLSNSVGTSYWLNQIWFMNGVFAVFGPICK